MFTCFPVEICTNPNTEWDDYAKKCVCVEGKPYGNPNDPRGCAGK